MINIDVFNIDTLAAKAKVSRRTIHYYLQRGLLMPPKGEGRGSHYTEEHLSRLKELQRLSSQGVPLEKIKEHFNREQTPRQEIRFSREDPAEGKPEKWERHQIAEGVELHVRVDAHPAGMSRELQERITSEVQKLLAPESNKE